jgi:hypothetical protein
MENLNPTQTPVETPSSTPTPVPTPAPKSEIRKEIIPQPIAISRVYEAQFQKEGTMTAELKQTITTKSYYPNKSVSSNLQDNPFQINEFSFKESEPFVNEETRVAWVDVPVGTTPEIVAERLANAPGACIYKILSNKPTISDNQQRAIVSKMTSLEAIASKQVVRYPKGHESEGNLIVDLTGKPQYRSVYFSMTAKEDIDLRTEDPADFYATKEISMELTRGAVPNTAAIVGDQHIL